MIVLIIKTLATKVDNLTKDKKQFDCLIQNINQLITSKKEYQKSSFIK